jgi:hypothetical protein
MDEENERILRVAKVTRELCRIGGPAIADGFIKYGDWLLKTINGERPERRRPSLSVVSHG